MGYHMAGFDVIGIDKLPQPNYPFDFIQWDVMDLNPARIARKFDAVHASPPCQAYSNTKTLHNYRHPNLVPGTRVLLEEAGLPYVIENVPGAPLRNPVQLCGSAFGLRVRRHRLFEASFGLTGTACEHSWQDLHRVYPSNHRHSSDRKSGVVAVWGSTDYSGHGRVREIAMGIDWMTTKELAQAIPPLYTRYIGKQLLREVK